MEEKVLHYLMDEEGLTEKAAGIVCTKLAKHPDILAEAAGWIDTRAFPQQGAVQVEGYTAEQLAQTAPLKPIGAFNYLVYLRNNPEKALEDLKNGLPRK